MKRGKRLLNAVLKGHQDQIVDLEFLATPPNSKIFVLGSCDKEGVVFLWFLYVAKDDLGIEVELKLLKKYSFIAMRKSTKAYYSRIRLAGTVENGTMLLVPNDGSDCRVINFHCEPLQPDNAPAPALPATEPLKQLPAPDTTGPAPETPYESSVPKEVDDPVTSSPQEYTVPPQDEFQDSSDVDRSMNLPTDEFDDSRVLHTIPATNTQGAEYGGSITREEEEQPAQLQRDEAPSLGQ